MKNFILEYVKKQSSKWKMKPRVVFGEPFQDALILVFGEPKTAIFAHMDSVGFTVRYQNQLVPIGSPEVKTGYQLTGEDGLGPIQCRLLVNEEGQLHYDFGRGIETGTTLVYKSDFRLDDTSVTSPYMDNRLGIYNALRVAESLEDGAIVFSTHEEHGGGSVPFLLKYLVENYQIKQCLISDITWVTEGVKPGNGVVISLRDHNIPRKLFLDKVIDLASKSNIPFQLEVEGSGSSDGREVQVSPYALDWCFIGAPEDNVHSPNEKVHLDDIDAMIGLYNYLMQKL